jgi:hypothetical protein
MGCPPAWDLGEGLKKHLVTKQYTNPRIVGCCEHGNEPSGSTKDREFVD